MRTHEGKARSINSEEFQRVIDETLKHSQFPERDTAILAVSFYSGLRAMEICNLNLGDILDNEGQIKQQVTLRKIGTKGAKGGVAYFSHPVLREYLSKYLVEKRSVKATECEAVFLSRVTKRFRPSSMSQLFTRLYQEAGLEGCTSHTGRRSLARNLNRSGVSLYNIQKVLRHANISQTVEYIDCDTDLLANIVSTV